MLEEKQKGIIRKLLEDMKKKLTLFFFTADGCEFCPAEKELLEELTELGKLELRVLDVKSPEAKKLGVNGAPMVVFEENPRVRFAGHPSGHEFRTFIDTIAMVSNGKTGLTAEVKKLVAGINKPVDLKVFVTPMCPYCPSAVATAHQFAIENKNITSTMIEAMEFPELSRKYGVMSVPKVVINDGQSFEGAVPPHVFAKMVLKSL